MVRGLEKVPLERCAGFLHRVVDGVCGRSFPERTDYADLWSLVEWLELIETLSSLFRTIVGKKCSDAEVQELLSDLKPPHVECVLHCVRSREEEIRLALVERTNGISTSQLKDFNWELKLALSSDKLASLHTPLLNLTLNVKENGTPRPVTIEMNQDELHTLTSAMEAANKVLLQLK
ncbi:COMM domain-containing protein 8 [Denticeps clupeoides]|uniref:COMM domain-containing protein n=1 Tax=Denticeps clupeoides TaxID=299321 RepID=A0AAY4CDQ5_9TELE|nr:COMM domain-containing protein 8 [Denticeps clupeoides]